MESPLPPKPGLNIQDILFILFRHKWKITFLTLLGISGAAAVWFTQKPVYQSRAKLLIRYVTETRDVLNTGPGDAEVVRDPDSRGSAIINSEIEILSSQDSFLQVARQVGPEKILAAYEGGTNLVKAAGTLKSQLKVESARNSSVITVFLGHRDPQVAREALDTLIQEYLRRHVDAHRAVGTYDILQAQTDQLRSRLAQTEDQLRREKNTANIISLDQSKADIASQRSTLQAAIFQTEAELAQLQAQLARHQPAQAAAEGEAPDSSPTNTNVTETIPQPTAREMADFQRLSNQLSSLLAARDQQLSIFQADSSAVQTTQRRIDEVEQALADLGFDPALITTQSTAAARSGAALGFDIASARDRALALEAKMAVYRKQLGQVLEQARLIDSVENSILTLERKKEVDDEKLRYFESNLERVRFDQAMDSGKVNNITLVEAPTSAGIDTSTVMKIALGILGGAIGLGLALSFGWDMLLDPTFKRPREVENALGLPLLASIPRFGSLRRKRRGEPPPTEQLPLALRELGVSGAEIAPWHDDDPMLPYYEALRDRVVMSYHGDTHKPKIVGLTSCNHGAGVTRLSLGLAAALSRDAERNVLFIALERNKVSLTAFAKGVPREALPHLENGSPVPEALPAQQWGTTAESEQVHVEKNLVSLTTTGRNLAGASIVQSFSDLLPKLKTADYDYIIFDLPPITQTSGSLRLASQMERTLLVVEAETTHKDKVERARKLINGAPTKLCTVLNKTKNYGPKSFNADA